MAKFDNILETVGNTPVVRINKLAPPAVNLYVKIEAFNPLGSVKDRLALGVIEDAERTRRAQARPDGRSRRRAATPASGSRWCAPPRAIRSSSRWPRAFSVERRRLMRFLGAKVVLTPAPPSAARGMVRQGRRARREARLVPDAASSRTRPTPTCTRAPRRAEILDDFAGERLDYWVTGFGTGGTLKGVGARAREGAARDQDRRLRAGRRADARQRHAAGAQRRRHASARHPAFKPHPMQGWSPDFIPKLTGDAVDDEADRPACITDRRPRRHAAERATLAQKEGIFVGITAGATFAGALEVARVPRRGSTILVHAARHRRALPQHAAVRRHPGRHERGGAGDLALDAEQSSATQGGVTTLRAAAAKKSPAQGGLLSRPVRLGISSPSHPPRHHKDKG